MTAWLIQIDAWQGSTAYPVRLASHDDERLCHLDDVVWWPAIAKLPTLRYDFFDGGFDAGSITSPSGSFDAAIEAIPALPALAIHDARIRIWSGDAGSAFAAFTLIFDGRVKEQPSVDAGTMSVSFGADDGWLDQPLLATYAGTGGAEGGEALKGQVKPLALGAPRYAPATLVDAIDNIYQLSGHGGIAAVDAAFERLNRFGVAAGNAADFAALKAATVTRGQWMTCLSGGFVRFGAPPDGMLCFHLGGDAVGGWSRLPGALIARVATIGGGAGRFAAGDMIALNAARPWTLSIMVTAQTTARELIQRIAMSVNAVAYVDWLGQLRVAPLAIGTASLTIAADGSSLPPVASVEQVAVAAPYWKLSQAAAVTWQVHALGDIAFAAPLNPRGPYDPAETYREGDIVTLPNGSQWLFIATTPAAGSEPADDNINWFRLSDAITAANITYEDGTPVEELKPAEPGATAGAPAGTPVGMTTAEDVAAALMALGSVTDPAQIVAGALALIERSTNQTLALYDIQLLSEERKQRFDDLVHMDGAALRTRVRSEIVERIEGQTALVVRTNEIEAAATDGVNAAMATISETEIVLASAIEAETFAREEQISQLQLDVDGQITTVTAALATEVTTRVNADEALVTAQEALAATMETEIATVNAAILTEQTARATGDMAEATSREALAATLTSDIADVSAAVESEATARAAEDGAIASALTAVQTTVDGHTASVAMLLESVDGLYARWGVRIDVDGYVTGVVMNNDGEEGSFDVLADNFRVVSPDGGDRTEYSDGTWRVFAGSIMTVWGVSFGSTGQFTRWDRSDTGNTGWLHRSQCHRICEDERQRLFQRRAVERRPEE